MNAEPCSSPGPLAAVPGGVAGTASYYKDFRRFDAFVWRDQHLTEVDLLPPHGLVYGGAPSTLSVAWPHMFIVVPAIDDPYDL